MGLFANLYFFIFLFFKILITGSGLTVVLIYFIFGASTVSYKSQKTVLGTDHIESIKTSPRLLKTHLPVQLIPKSVWDNNCRVSDL